MKSEWTIDRKAGTATHNATGLVLTAQPPDADGAFDMLVTTIPPDLPADAAMLARMAREGGDAYAAALRRDPAVLTEAGRLLHGSAWHAALAADLGVDRRTVYRWQNAQTPIPPGIRAELRALLVARGGDIAALVERL